MDELRRPRAVLSPRLIVGLGIMAAGLLLALDNLGLVEAWDYLRYWPILIVAIGLTKLAEARDGRGATGALLWIGVGVVLLAQKLLGFRLSQLWPVVLLAVGARVAWGAFAAPARREVEPESSDTFNVFAMMGGVARGISSQQFRGGHATAIMGGCELDLRHASTGGGEAVVDTFALWGGIEIKVPEDWEVDTRGFALMGAYEDTSKRPATPRGRLVLTGMALMGGVEVKN